VGFEIVDEAATISQARADFINTPPPPNAPTTAFTQRTSPPSPQVYRT